MGRSRGTVAPVASSSASLSSRSRLTSTDPRPPRPTAVPVTKSTPLGAQQVDAPLHGSLVELHVGDAVHQQTAEPVFALVDGDPMARRVELRGRGQTRRSRPDDGDAPARPRRGRIRHHPALRKAAVDDGHLDILDGHRRVGDAEDAGAFARGRTHAPGELREVVRLVQTIERLAPAPLVDEVVPLRNQVVDGAAVIGLAERDAAVHATGALGGQTRFVVRGVDLVEVEQPCRGVPIGRRFAHELLESGCLAHVSTVRRPRCGPPNQGMQKAFRPMPRARGDPPRLPLPARAGHA